MSNYWLDLIKKEEEMEKARKEQEKRELEVIFRDHKQRERIKTIWNIARSKNKN